MGFRNIFIYRHLVAAIIFCLYFQCSKCQTAFQIKNERTMPLKFIQCDGTDKYISTSQYHKAVLKLYPDSTFELHYLNSEAFDLAIGRYYTFNNFIYFIWDSVKTNSAISDTNIYKKYYRLQKANPFKINKTVFKFFKKTINSTIERDIFDKVEFFITSKDLYTHGIFSDSLSDFPIPFTFTYMLPGIKIILNKKFEKNISCNLDTIWGFRCIYRNGTQGSFFRVNPADTMCYRVLQYDGMIIYSFKGLAYHSKNHTQYYFSENIDSPMFKLNLPNLKECYKSNQAFIDVLEKDKDLAVTYWKNGLISMDENGKFNLLKVYQKSLIKNN